MGELTCLEICAGAGGQSLGLEQAGFTHAAVVELDPDACETLRLNRGSEWKIIEDDVHNVDGRAFSGIDLLSGGVPCPPFSIAGKQLGQEDDRDLFPSRLLDQAADVRDDRVALRSALDDAVLHVDDEECGVRAVLECGHGLLFLTLTRVVHAP